MMASKALLSDVILAREVLKMSCTVWKSIGRSVVIRPLFSAREINRALGCNPATIFLATSFSVCSWRLFIWLRRAFYLAGPAFYLAGQLQLFICFGWAGFLFGWAGFLFGWASLFI